MSLTLLAVDDSRTIRDMLKLALTEAGFTLHLAEDGVHGLDVLEGIAPDAIIPAINIPRLHGFGLIQPVRGQHRHRTIALIPVASALAALRAIGFEGLVGSLRFRGRGRAVIGNASGSGGQDQGKRGPDDLLFHGLRIDGEYAAQGQSGQQPVPPGFSLNCRFRAFACSCFRIAIRE